MKFGNLFLSKIYPPWRFYYLDYDKIKEFIKRRISQPNGFGEYDEKNFIELLDAEISKVTRFKDFKGDEIKKRASEYEDRVQRFDLKNADGYVISNLKQDIEKITNELIQLGRFTRYNYTGILKIVKKHDKHTSFVLRHIYMMRLNDKPIYYENIDLLIYELSMIYYGILSPRKDDSSNKGSSNADITSQSFVRRTTKYWVHYDNVTDLKILIMKHLPVLVYRNSGRLTSKPDQSISSVYLDNENMELYSGRLERLEGAEAIRVRWYGQEDPEEVFIERKVHREDWTGEKSVKNRFPLKEKYVDAFIRGEYILEKKIAKMRESGKKTESEIENLENLSSEIQGSIVNKGLRPILRTFYNRTAFQVPGNASVRISLDTELCMIKEGISESWKRKDVMCDYPFGYVSGSEIVRFPYAILEVKLQTELGGCPPKWVSDITNGPLVEAVPKFSKFTHGCAIIYENKVPMFPFWLPQMDVDIRNPISPSRFHNADAGGFLQNGPGNMDALKSNVMYRDRNDSVKSIEYLDREKDAVLDSKDKCVDKKGGTRFSLRGWLKKRRERRSEKKLGSLLSKSGEKKIQIPVRVEPKVFFANERTFLSWLHFSIFLGGISAALVGLGNGHAKISGLIFAATSVLFSIYALYLYYWRCSKIRQRDPGPYDDLVGPIFLVVVFLAAMAMNVFFNVYEVDGQYVTH